MSLTFKSILVLALLPVLNSNASEMRGPQLMRTMTDIPINCHEPIRKFDLHVAVLKISTVRKDDGYEIVKEKVCDVHSIAGVFDYTKPLPPSDGHTCMPSSWPVHCSTTVKDVGEVDVIVNASVVLLKGDIWGTNDTEISQAPWAGFSVIKRGDPKEIPLPGREAEGGGFRTPDLNLKRIDFVLAEPIKLSDPSHDAPNGQVAIEDYFQVGVTLDESIAR